MNIDELIKKSKSMPNISDGGSAAFSFGDYVLVEYCTPNIYGDARENEEKVMEAINNKNSKGVNTPKHIAIKRVIDGDKNYCYVLQEKAPGESFMKYYSSNNKNEEQLIRQQELLDIPLEHFIKLAKDYGELFHMGLEPKAKNIFYDKEKGFTLIDLLEYDESGINYDSLSDDIYLVSLMSCISNITVIHNYRCEDKEIVAKSKELFYKLQAKIYLALKEVIPDKYRRFILRMYNNEMLNYFYQEKVIDEDLTLNKEEIEIINKKLDDIINESFDKVNSGEYQLWQIELNEIKNDLIGNGIIDSYMYYPNSNIKKEDYKDKFDYEYAIRDYLINYCLDKFYDLVMNAEPNNVYIINVQAEIMNKKATK